MARTEGGLSVLCFFNQIGLGGGGKVVAVQRRLNVMAEDPRLDPVLVTTRHNVNQRAVFAKLKKDGRLHARVRYRTLYELAAEVHPGASAPEPAGLPLEMLLNTPPRAEAGFTGRRNDPETGARILYLNGAPLLRDMEPGDDTRLLSYYANGRLVAATLHRGGVFEIGVDALSGRAFATENDLMRALTASAVGPGTVSFVDGVTLAWMMRDIRAPKILFLHADHRNPDGTINAPARNLIENFRGDVIATATERHCKLVHRDLAPRRPIMVMPHCVDLPHAPPIAARRHICTVSRLDLEGKPIDDAIRAFAAIRHEVPDVDYLIYGSGTGEAALAALIEALDCAGRIRLMGYTTDPAGAFGAAIASVYPTLTEGFGLSLLESLASGCPVVTYDVDFGPRELIRDGENGRLVPPGDETALIGALRDVLSDRGGYSARAAMGLERYGRAAHARAYHDLVDIALYLHRLRTGGEKGPRPRSAVLDALFAPDWKAERAHLELVDLRAAILDDLDDRSALYELLLAKAEGHQYDHRLVQRLIWLTHHLGLRDATVRHLRTLAADHPDAFAAFTTKYGVFRVYLDENTGG